MQTPIQRDSSDPGVGDLFGEDADTAGREPSDDRVTNMTAPTLPAPRRPTPPKQTDQPQAQNRTQTQGQQPTARPGPALAHTEPEPAKGGNSVLRWLVVLLLIAAGAAVGIMLGQALI